MDESSQTFVNEQTRTETLASGTVDRLRKPQRRERVLCCKLRHWRFVAMLARAWIVGAQMRITSFWRRSLPENRSQRTVVATRFDSAGSHILLRFSY